MATRASALDAIGHTPLIELPRLSPAGGARVLVKWEGANPTGSMKDRMALAMVRRGRAEGLLREGQRVVEFTGGSTGTSLAFVCGVLGHPLTIVTADCVAETKIASMRALGADVEVLATPEGKVYPGLVDAYKKRVEEIRDATGAYWTHQMGNPHQLDGYDAMADEILRDAPDVAAFVMMVGTGGCAMGTGRGLKRRSDARVLLVEPAESPWLTTGAGGSHGVEGTAVVAEPPLLDNALYDDVVTVPEATGRAMARRLAREEGILAGTSSGLNVAAAVEVARGLPEDAVVVTVAVDTGLKYLGGSLFSEG